jgi:ABC-type polar amino acid transport system ATPase subunit
MIASSTANPASDQGDSVTIHGVHKRFGNIEVLRGIDLEIPRGNVVVVIGRSGSGKTTLLRCVSGLETHDAGEITIFGRRVRHAWELHGEVGFVFQQFNLFPNRTAAGNVMLALRKVRRMPKAQARAVALEMLDRVGLRSKADSRPSKLSGGQQQRVAIARALAMKPKLMLFDEPTSALDRELVVEVLRVMEDLANDGMTMMVVTHELFFAEHAADTVVFIDEGRIVEQGPPPRVLRHPSDPRTRQFMGLITPELAVDEPPSPASPRPGAAP